jgi:hypothetical protein
MADIAINKSNAKRYLNGSIPPSSPNTIDGEPVPPSSIVGGGEWVPYLGAKDNVDLGEYFLKASHLKLKTDLETIPTDQGSMYWDEDEETIAVILNGSTTKVGEDIFFQVKNQSGSTIPKGTAVRFNGVVGASGRINIVPFLANGSNPSIYFLGVTYEAIADGADGKALFNGKIRGLDTSAFAVGDILYASPTVAGGFTTTKPIAPNNIISVAAVLSSGANGILLIRPQIGSNINNDEGVKITTPTTGDILQLQASGLWENKSRLAAGLIAGSGTTNYLAKFTAGGTVGNSALQEVNSNLGLGVTPSAWSAGVYAMDLGSGTAILNPASDAQTWYLTNAYHNAGFKYKNSGNEASWYQQVGGTHAWHTAPSGTAGNAISFTQAMTLVANGNLLINTITDAGFRLDVNGSGRFSGGASGVGLAVKNTTNAQVLEMGYSTGSGAHFLQVYDGSSFQPLVINNALTLASTGAATFSSSVTATAFITSSDKRKKDIISQDGDLAIYRFKGDSQIHYGYIAQDMRALYPNQVNKGADGMLSLNYVEILVKKVHDLESKLKRHGLD